MKRYTVQYHGRDPLIKYQFEVDAPDKVQALAMAHDFFRDIRMWSVKVDSIWEYGEAVAAPAIEYTPFQRLILRLIQFFERLGLK